MATENNHDFNHNNDTKEWKIRPSRMARNTKNYIRDLVENLNLTPNPEKQVIALSIGKYQDIIYHMNSTICEEIILVF